MAEKQIQTLKPRHEAIMDWLIGHPTETLGACAQAFGVTQSWLSVIVNSDVFQSRLREKTDETFLETVVPLRDRMMGLAHRAYERLSEKVEFVQDPKMLLDIADKTAHRLGYAPTKGPDPAAPQQVNVQQNFYTADPTVLAAARDQMQRLREASAPVAERKGETIDSPALPAPQEL